MEGSSVVGTPANKPKARAPRPKKSKGVPPASQIAPSPTTSALPHMQGAIVSQLQSSVPRYTASFNTLQQSAMILPDAKMSQPAHTVASKPASQVVGGRQLASVPHTTNESHTVTVPQTVNGNQLLTLPQLTNNNPVFTLSSAVSSDGIAIMVTQPTSQSHSAAGLMSAPLITQPQGAMHTPHGQLTTVTSTQGLAKLMTSTMASQSPAAVVTHVSTSPAIGTVQVPLTSVTVYSNNIMPKASTPLCSTQSGSISHTSTSSYSGSQLSQTPDFQSTPQTSITTEVTAGSKTVASLLRQRQPSTAQVRFFFPYIVFTLDAVGSEFLTHVTG